MIRGYADLLVTAGNYAGRNDVAHVLPLLLGLAEEKLNNELRVGQMEKAGILNIVGNEAFLPDDFLEMREAANPAGRQLQSVPLSVLSSRYGHSGGQNSYSVVRNTIRTGAGFSGEMYIIYYARIPGLTPTNPTNWLLQLSPNTYLYALVEEIAIWSKNADLTALARGEKERAMNGVSINDERARFANARVVIGGHTP